MNRARALRSVALTLALAAPAASQTTYVEEGRLYEPPAGIPFPAFGGALSMSGNRVAVGDRQSSSTAIGEAFVFVRSAGMWDLEAEIHALDAAADDRFGCDVSLDGDTLLVGAEFADHSGKSNPGAAYVFVRNGSSWIQQAKLVAGDPLDNSNFGLTVAVDGDTAVVGAPVHNSAVGAIYVFVRNGSTWSQQQKLAQTNLAPGTRFGSAVAIDGDRCLSGAPQNQVNGQLLVGVTYVYERSGGLWSLSGALTPVVTDFTSRFGAAVALEDQRVLVGAPGESFPDVNTGAAYVFEKNGAFWTQTQKLVGIGTDFNDTFGASVDLSGNWIAIGAPFHSNAQAAGSGTVKLFELSGGSWIERLDMVGNSTDNADQLGVSVAIEAGRVIGGASDAEAPTGGTPGEAYVWQVNPPVVSGYCTAKQNSAGCAPQIAWSGTPSVSSPAAFLVTASLVLSQKPGLLLYGMLYNQLPFQGGILCVAPPTTRTAVQQSGGSPSGNDCTGAYAFDLNDHVQSGADPALVVGEDVYCQYWYRDPASQGSTGLTAAIRARIQP